MGALKVGAIQQAMFDRFGCARSKGNSLREEFND